jgi:hypothetical protein
MDKLLKEKKAAIRKAIKEYRKLAEANMDREADAVDWDAGPGDEELQGYYAAQDEVSWAETIEMDYFSTTTTGD